MFSFCWYVLPHSASTFLLFCEYISLILPVPFPYFVGLFFLLCWYISLFAGTFSFLLVHFPYAIIANLQLLFIYVPPADFFFLSRYAFHSAIHLFSNNFTLNLSKASLHFCITRETNFLYITLGEEQWICGGLVLGVFWTHGQFF